MIFSAKTNEIIKTVQANVKGILPGTQGHRLAEIAQLANGPRIEIGALVGYSTCVIGLASSDSDLIISIDPFQIQYLSDMARGVVKDSGGDLSAGSFLPIWKRNVTKVAPSKRIVPVAGDRLKKVKEVKRLLNGEKAGLLFVDGLHGYEDVKKDIAAYLPLVKDGGYVVFHDYAKGRGVFDAVNEAIAKGKLAIVDNSYQLVTKKPGR
jgi:predicted O-methyltransferase YrrM